ARPLALVICRLQVHEHLLELDPVAVLDEDLGDLAAPAGRDLVHHLHRLDDADGLAGLDRGTDLGERLGAGLRGAVEGPYERRQHRHPVVLLQVADREHARGHARAGGDAHAWACSGGHGTRWGARLRAGRGWAGYPWRHGRRAAAD